jgi:putative transposase
VLNRSVGRIKLFRHDKDFLAFERALTQALQRHPIEIFAYCVMPTHWHLVVRPKRDRELSTFMKWLTLTHVQRWRTAHDTVGYGPLYQGRFKSFVIEEDNHLETVLRYVERNPVRANLTRAAESWKWCSLYRRMNGDADARALLSPWPIGQRADWVKFVNKPQTGAEEESLRQSIVSSRPYGNRTWQLRMAKELNLESSLRSPGRPKKVNL